MTDTAPPYIALDERLIDWVQTPHDLTRLHPVQLAPDLETVIRDLGFTPSDQQRRALQMAWDFVLNGPTHARYMGIWGYAGVGKSTVIQLLIKGLKRRSQRCTVAMCAPTNKAVKVLRTMAKRTGLFGITFGTIHSMLNLKRDWDEHGKEIWKPKQMQKRSGQPSIEQFDLIILDEASMVGADLWEQIQVAIAAATGDYTPQLIAMGDPAQLPPVKTSRRKSSQDLDGEPQRESPLFRDIEHSLTLTQVMRYGGSIGLLATHIREHLESEQLHPCSLAEFDHDCQRLRQEALEIPTEQSDRRRAAWRKFYQHMELFAAVEYGFCLTIHSAQGSTFERVYIPMPDIVANPRERERNQLFYTAVTRARQQVILGV